jgi:hypothetical protein
LNKSKDANVPALKASASEKSDKKKKKEKKSDEEMNFESFLSEVESDLRDDALANIWKTYGAHIIGVAAMIVAGVFGYQLYADYIVDRRDIMAMTYAEAADAADAGDTEIALAKLSEIGDVSGEGYSAVARLTEASLLVDQGDVDGALSIYQVLASDSSVDPVFRDLAVVLKVMHSMDTAEPGLLESELAPISGPGQPFRHSALELAALLAAKQGERERAQQYLSETLSDPTAPSGLLSRVRDLFDLYASENASVSPDEAAEDVGEAPS